MAVKTETTYVCDRCGTESSSADFSDGSSCGKASITVDGSIGGKTYDGAWGGYGVKLDDLVCFKCLKEFQVFYDSGKPS